MGAHREYINVSTENAATIIRIKIVKTEAAGSIATLVHICLGVTAREAVILKKQEIM
jgi:hypothetical protein